MNNKFKNYIKEIKEFRFKKEFFPKILFLLFSLFLAIILSIFSFVKFFRDLPNDSKVFFLTFIIFLLLIIIIAILEYSNVFINVVANIDKKIRNYEKTEPDINLGFSAENGSFAKNLTDIIENLSESLLREYSSKLLQKQAELDAMQNQINPHFLYNTLDSIRGMALEEGSNDTAEMIESLSILFRYTISQSRSIVTIEQELKNVDNYIKIQQYRFNNRFEVVKIADESDDQIMSYKMPKLTIQPIIENAIYHGFDSMITKGTIIIRIYTTQSRLIISISDNGIGMASKQLNALNEKLMNEKSNTQNGLTTSGSGIALVNVNARIKLRFGEKYGLTAYSTEGIGTEIQIVLPLMENNYEERNS